MALPRDPLHVEFVLSFEDWLEARASRPRNEKERVTLHADYLRFSAEQRSFHADADGWTYCSSGGKVKHSWSDLMGTMTLDHVIVLMTMQGHYSLPHRVFREGELKSLTDWLDRVKGTW
jgi:hypothetical protein